MSTVIDQPKESRQLLQPNLGMHAARGAVVAEVVANLQAAAGCGEAADQATAIRVGNVHVVYANQGPPNNWKTRPSSTDTAREVAEIIGTDALRYALVLVTPDKPMLLDIETWLTRSERNPLFRLQLAHSQMVGIGNRLVASGQTVQVSDVDGYEPSGIKGAAKPLAALVAHESHHIADAARLQAPDRLIRYLTAVVGAWDAVAINHLFPQPDAEISTVAAHQLSLIHSAQHVLFNGLSLLGITAPERL